MKRLLCLLVLAAVAVPFPAGAQSLAEVAKKEEARRKAVKQTGKVYTNDNLKGDISKTPAATGSGGGHCSPAPEHAGAVGEPARRQGRADEPERKDQAYWSARMNRRAIGARPQPHLRRRAAEPHQRAHDRLRQSRRSGAARRSSNSSGSARSPSSIASRRRSPSRPRRSATSRKKRARPACRRAGCAAEVSSAPEATILLVEDKDSLRTMLRHALEAQGHHVVEARDQPEAVERLQGQRAGGRPVRSAAPGRRRLRRAEGRQGCRSRAAGHRDDRVRRHPGCRRRR